MTDLIEPHSESVSGAPVGERLGDPAADRRARQARIALLRNPNRKPLPPPRRPPLLGRNLKLRSTRRPGSPAVPEPEAATEAAAAPEETLVRDLDGRILRIDVDRLEALTQQMLPPRQVRTAYADHILGAAAASNGQPAKGPRVTADPQSLRQQLADPVEDAGNAAPALSGWRRLIGRLTGRP